MLKKNLAALALVAAIAPFPSTFPVAAEVPTAGSRRVRSQSRNGTAVSLDPYVSAFTAGDRAALRALCGDSVTPGAPVGSFPVGGTVERVWPE
jgi:hypothetical protein